MAFHREIKRFKRSPLESPGSDYSEISPIKLSNISAGQIITTSAEVTLNGGLIRELPQNPLNSGLGIILICPDFRNISGN